MHPWPGADGSRGLGEAARPSSREGSTANAASRVQRTVSCHGSHPGEWSPCLRALWPEITAGCFNPDSRHPNKTRGSQCYGHWPDGILRFGVACRRKRTLRRQQACGARRSMPSRLRRHRPSSSHSSRQLGSRPHPRRTRWNRIGSGPGLVREVPSLQPGVRCATFLICQTLLTNSHHLQCLQLERITLAAISGADNCLLVFNSDMEQ